MIQRAGISDFIYIAHSQTAEISPRVQVWTNGVLASCARDSGSTDVTTPRCYFTYAASHTPVVTTVQPLAGLSGGSSLTIQGVGFAAVTTGNRIVIGGQPCNIVTASTTQLTCQVGHLPAGMYNLSVLVPMNGSGYAVVNPTQQELSFVARVSSLYPITGSACGGYTISVQGTGFGASDSMNTVSGCCRSGHVSAVGP